LSGQARGWSPKRVKGQDNAGSGGFLDADHVQLRLANEVGQGSGASEENRDVAVAQSRALMHRAAVLIG